MHGDLFDSTLPAGAPELMRTSAYNRYLEELEAKALHERAGVTGVSTRISSLSPSLLADLQRFERGGNNTDVLEVLAACVRHAKRVTVHLQCGQHVVPLTVFPQDQLVHSPMDLSELFDQHLAGLRVMHVELALRRPPGDSGWAPLGEAHLHHPLPPLLWALALRGQRSALLPEIAGAAVYRVAPALDIMALPVRGALQAAVQRLRLRTVNLREISEWPGLTREGAQRLLNALYLQAGLIVSRSHPAALGQGWLGLGGR